MAGKRFCQDPYSLWETRSRRQLYILYRECVVWQAEERREAWNRDAHFYRTAGKTFKDVREPDWARVEPDWKALYPERYPAYAAQLGAPRKTQWELYQELLASGRLAHIQQTRQQRAEAAEAAQPHDPRGIPVTHFEQVKERMQARLYG